MSTPRSVSLRINLGSDGTAHGISVVTSDLPAPGRRPRARLDELIWIETEFHTQEAVVGVLEDLVQDYLVPPIRRAFNAARDREERAADAE